MRSRSLRPHTVPRGMTLVELVISIGLLAVMTTISYTVIHGSSEVSEEATARSDLSKMGRNAMEMLRRELSQAFISQNQTEYYKTVFKAVDRDPVDEVHFVSKAHEVRHANRKEGNVAEYSYFSESDWRDGNYRTLVHRESPNVDDDEERGGRLLALSHNVRELNLRYFDEKKEEWVDEWDSESADNINRVPRAIEIRLELEDKEGRTASFFTRTLVTRR